MTTADPLVSVIVPVFNLQDLFQRGLKSVQEQTYSKLQIICIDDGSTDQSLAQLQQIQAQDERIEVYSQTNGGLAAARNTGLQYVRGSYIYFFDPDDYLDLNLLDHCVRQAQKQKADIVVFNSYDVQSSTDQIIREVHQGTTPATAGAVAWNKLFTRACWQKGFFPPRSIKFEDSAIIPLKVAQAQKVVLIPECLYYYVRERPGSLLTAAQGNSFAATFTSIIYLLDQAEKQGVTSSQKTAVASYALRKLTATVAEYNYRIKTCPQTKQATYQQFFHQCQADAQLSWLRQTYARLIYLCWRSHFFAGLKLLNYLKELI
ncbi:glycosyltransferase family 2 protein [Lactobacillus sp. DCY120]|uniref:Glycosyltransferase family 2 protein n=1 Tax=Bombilactobacillus apium TaxID=2675299 RepID=A0A850R157_9LACO|nr:glycosyltransferase family 2 protein [Bombilactobacillus apium]NVY96090.1 glycosyltransferase family 2 protein [Bombilactobacillus apium]